MVKYPTLAIFVLISNMIIIIAAGHGICPLGIFVWLLPVHSLDSGLSPFNTIYQGLNFAACLLSLLGELILIINIFLKKQQLVLIALPILYIGLCCLIFALFDKNDEASMPSMSVYTAIPFLILSIAYFIRSFMDRNIDINLSR